MRARLRTGSGAARALAACAAAAIALGALFAQSSARAVGDAPHFLPAATSLAQLGRDVTPRQDPSARTPLGALLARARLLLERGEATEAYAVLSDGEPLYAGFPEYDLLLGIAAIDAGRPARAIFPLERVLAAEPSHLRARAEIARAHYLLGELEAARREFRTVGDQEVPAAVRTTIDRYLAAIEGATTTVRRAASTAHLSFAAGYDSNVNLGTDLSQWIAAGGLRLLPEASSLAREGSFVRFGGRFGHVAPMDERWEWYAQAAFEQRLNSVRQDVNLGTLDLTVGLGYREECHRVSVSAQLQHARLDDDPFRNAAGLTAQWLCELAERRRTGGYAQVFSLDFPGQQGRDAQRVQAGIFHGREFGGARRPFLLGALYAGGERSRRDLPEFDFDFVGLRFVSEVTLSPGWRGYAVLSYEHRKFDGVNPLFSGLDRTDRDLELQIGVEHPIGDWTITPALVLTRVWSTIDPNDYRRTQAYLLARYRFR